MDDEKEYIIKNISKRESEILDNNINWCPNKIK